MGTHFELPLATSFNICPILSLESASTKATGSVSSSASDGPDEAVVRDIGTYTPRVVPLSWFETNILPPFLVTFYEDNSDKLIENLKAKQVTTHDGIWYYFYTKSTVVFVRGMDDAAYVQTRDMY